ncbi:MAG: NYN domain-containing protein [Deltaproteobacteria bacterium]|nr:NYN domain-containing protein [Deltaproteobacteria bacterium]MBW2649152.1 NYN domain-containing protein [Deltaproteobacteria bacterium]
MHIIIDGYNLIRQSDSLKRLERFSLEEGRNGLMKRVAGYKKLKDHKITVVFDGWANGSAREERLRENGVHIVYSRRGETADKVIKRMAMAGRGGEIIVVTSDRDVADSVVKAGGVAISSPEFETRMNEAEMMAMIHGGEPCKDDDYDIPESGTRKKGAAKRKPKRERQAQRRLSKL